MHESSRSWGYQSPSSISYVMASWSPSQSWTADAICLRTTAPDAGGYRSKLRALMDAMANSSDCEWGGGAGTTTTDLWWTLFSPSTSTAGRWCASPFATQDRLRTALSQSFWDRVYLICVEFLRRLREGEATE